MKIIANRKSLLAALSAAAPVAAKARHQEILQNVLISANANERTVIGTDANVVIRQKFEAETGAPGQTLAPGMLLKAMLAQMTEDAILIQADEKGVMVRGERTQHKLPIIDAKAYPALPDPKWAAECEMPAAQLSAAIRAVSPMTDLCDGKTYAIGSVLVEFNEKSVAFVASDGNALAAVEFDVAPSATASALILPASARIAAGIEGGQAKLLISDNWLAVEWDCGTIMARLSEGRFPRWRSEFTPQKCIAEIVPSVTLAAIRRACVAPSQSENSERLTIAIADGTCSLKRIIDGFDSESEFPCATQGALDSVFNWRYLIDTMNGLLVFGDLPAAVSFEDRRMYVVRENLRFIIGNLE